MNAPDKSAALNVSSEARELAALVYTPRTLTTADIGSFAASCLLRLREDGDRLLAEAHAHPGEERALHCARSISSRFDQVSNTGILALLALRHDDPATCAAIEADIDATSRRLICQATSARMISVPKVRA